MTIIYENHCFEHMVNAELNDLCPKADITRLMTSTEMYTGLNGINGIINVTVIKK